MAAFPKQEISFEILSEFMMTEPKSWGEVFTLARELRDVFLTNSFYEATPNLRQTNLRNSNVCFGIELGANVAMHQESNFDFHSTKSELQKALDYSLSVIVFQKYLERMSHRDVLKGITDEPFEHLEQTFQLPASAIIEQLRGRAYDELENAIQSFRLSNISIPPSSVIEAVIREQFHKQRKGPVPDASPNVPDHLYGVIPMLLELPQSREDDREPPIKNPPREP